MNPANVIPLGRPVPEPPSDEEIARRVLAGETALFEILMRRHNPKVYRAIRGVVRDEAAVEDLMQQTYLQAFSHLRAFDQKSQLSTWLYRIALNQALMYARRGKTAEAAAPVLKQEESVDSTPENGVARRELARLLEAAIDRVPEHHRVIFMLREVNELSTTETAEVLGVTEAVVKTRLRRARAIIRKELEALTGEAAAGAFEFHATRCDRVVTTVLARLKP